MAYQLENDFFCIKHFWAVYEQNNIVTSVRVAEWTPKWVIIAGFELTALNRNPRWRNHDKIFTGCIVEKFVLNKPSSLSSNLVNSGSA